MSTPGGASLGLPKIRRGMMAKPSLKSSRCSEHFTEAEPAWEIVPQMRQRPL